MKLWLLVVGTILVYITVANDAKRINGDLTKGNPTSLVEEQEGMVRVKRAVGGKKYESPSGIVYHIEKIIKRPPKNPGECFAVCGRVNRNPTNAETRWCKKYGYKCMGGHHIFVRPPARRRRQRRN